MYTVRLYNDRVLKLKTQPVTKFDASLKSIVDEMVETVVEYDGVGLAAPQVGLSIRLSVIDVTLGKDPPIVLANPEILEFSDETVEREEGCLSFPGLSLNIARPAWVTVRAQDIKGKEYTIEKADDLLGRCLQHEIDHINGFLIIDRISLLQRQMINGRLKKLIREYSESREAA